MLLQVKDSEEESESTLFGSTSDGESGHSTTMSVDNTPEVGKTRKSEELYIWIKR